MKKYFFLGLFSGLIFLVSCHSSNELSTCQKGNMNGTLRIAENVLPGSLFPHQIDNAVSSQVVSFIHEGLVKDDPITLATRPGLAMRWDVDSTHTEYIFYLNGNAYFHDDACFPKGKGRKVTANDVLYSFTMLCTKNDDNTAYGTFIDQIAGAKDFYENKASKISGLTIKNDSTFIIKLVKPNSMFLHFLASPMAVIFPKEAYDTYKTNFTVGIGPFYINHYPKNDEPMILCRNLHYFKQDDKGNCLPYLDTVKIYFVGSLKKQLEMLKNGQLDIVMNVDNETMTSFLDQNIKLFEGEQAPLKVITSNHEEANPVQHIIRSTIQNFNINSQNQFDITEVKILNDTTLTKK